MRMPRDARRTRTMTVASTPRRPETLTAARATSHRAARMPLGYPRGEFRGRVVVAQLASANRALPVNASPRRRRSCGVHRFEAVDFDAVAGRVRVVGAGDAYLDRVRRVGETIARVDALAR